MCREMEKIYSEGMESGEKRGIEKGELKKAKETALSMAEEGMPHCGLAGVMRNEGIRQAKGEYCLFLDGDDFFEPEMLEHSLRKAREDDADICMFDARMYYEATKTYKKSNVILKTEYIPEQIPFEGKSFPYIFNSSVCFDVPICQKNVIPA